MEKIANLTEEQRREFNRLYTAYELTGDDFFQHKNYTIITRTGIEKIQAIEEIKITYEVIECTPNFAAVKASGSKKTGVMFETLASALKGGSYKDGNTHTWHVLEVAQKRAKGRLVLEIIGWYKHNIYSEDESEDFKKKDA